MGRRGLLNPPPRAKVARVLRSHLLPPFAGWPQSQLHSSAAMQNKIYEETLATTPGTQELLSSVKSAGEFYMP